MRGHQRRVSQAGQKGGKNAREDADGNEDRHAEDEVEDEQDDLVRRRRVLGARPMTARIESRSAAESVRRPDQRRTTHKEVVLGALGQVPDPEREHVDVQGDCARAATGAEISSGARLAEVDGRKTRRTRPAHEREEADKVGRVVVADAAADPVALAARAGERTRQHGLALA